MEARRGGLQATPHPCGHGLLSLTILLKLGFLSKRLVQLWLKLGAPGGPKGHTGLNRSVGKTLICPTLSFSRRETRLRRKRLAPGPKQARGRARANMPDSVSKTSFPYTGPKRQGTGFEWQKW